MRVVSSSSSRLQLRWFLVLIYFLAAFSPYFVDIYPWQCWILLLQPLYITFCIQIYIILKPSTHTSLFWVSLSASAYISDKEYFSSACDIRKRARSMLIRYSHPQEFQATKSSLCFFAFQEVFGSSIYFNISLPF